MGSLVGQRDEACRGVTRRGGALRFSERGASHPSSCRPAAPHSHAPHFLLPLVREFLRPTVPSAGRGWADVVS